MKVNKWTLGLAAAGLVSLPTLVQAEEKASSVMTALSSTTISGYVDTSAQWDVGTGNANPPGFIVPPEVRSPPRFTATFWSKVGVTAPFFALDERIHRIGGLVLAVPTIKRLPLVSTSGVPHMGELGMLIGFIQVTPPSVERLNCRPP